MAPQKRNTSPGGVAARNGIGRTSVYAAINSGALIARKFGARTIITPEAEAAWLKSLPKLRSRDRQQAAAPS
jgi:hypothetical protein